MPTARVNGFDMHYQVIGEGEPVVCTTGWGTGTGHRVAAYPDALLEDYQLVVYDHRGTGRSSGGLDAEPTTERYADDVVALMDVLGITRAKAFGRGGLGGCIAQQLAIRHQHRFSCAIFGQAWSSATAFLHAQFETLAALRRKSFADFQLAAAWLCHRPEFFEAHRNELLGPRGMWSDISDVGDAHLALIEASARHDVEAELASVRIPVLIVQGGPYDWITGERLGTRQAELLPHARYEVLESAPHAIKSHGPSWARYSELVMSFLGNHGGGGDR